MTTTAIEVLRVGPFGMDNKDQVTEYLGTAADLVKHGITPQVLFDNLGRSNTKSGAVLGHPNIYIRGKRKGERYLVNVYHPIGKAPYKTDLHDRTRTDLQGAHKVQARLHPWPADLKCLYRLNALCELYQETHGGDKIRAVANWTGVADVLPPEGVRLDHNGTRKLFRLDLLATINRTCMELLDEVSYARHFYLSQVMQMTVKLSTIVELQPSEEHLEGLAEEIEERHGEILREIYRKPPEPDDFDQIHETLAALMWKYSKKAINGHKLKPAA